MMSLLSFCTCAEHCPCKIACVNLCIQQPASPPHGKNCKLSLRGAVEIVKNYKSPSPAPGLLQAGGLLEVPGLLGIETPQPTNITNSNQNRRSAALLGLPYFMKEDPSNFIKFCEATDSEEAAAVNRVDVGVLIVTEEREPAALPKNIADVAVILEGRIVLRKLRDVPTGFAVLMGILYSLIIDYPKGLKYTFEVIQKVIMDIGGGTCSARAHGLRNKLLQRTI
ncbi:hypothetical protein NQZ68_034834 [Dissostichus eleginoides]|nr:hypothetical protein NQZ68_034834 [Dissostichus eleginoides]